MIARYFAYGSNMNPDRVSERGLRIESAMPGSLTGFRLNFDKCSTRHPGVGHASFAYHPGASLEGVLYELRDAADIALMDRFESAPVNYSREVIEVRGPLGNVWSWTYVANPAVLNAGLKPPRSYLDHLLAGADFLSAEYLHMLSNWECVEDR